MSDTRDRRRAYVVSWEGADTTYTLEVWEIEGKAWAWLMAGDLCYSHHCFADRAPLDLPAFGYRPCLTTEHGGRWLMVIWIDTTEPPSPFAFYWSCDEGESGWTNSRDEAA